MPVSREDTCHGGMTATELLVHAMDQLEDVDADRVIVIILCGDGRTIQMHSNTRNDAEFSGLLGLAVSAEPEGEEEG